MRIAQLSDVHVLDLEGVTLRRFFNKRITGLANLRGKRHNAHPIALLERAIDDVLAQEVDHVVVTGDLTNLSLESEFSRARELLSRLGGPDRLSVIPGNHDVYTRGAQRARRFEGYFGEWMWPPGKERTYPWHKQVGDVELFGFCSAVPRMPLIATGVVSKDQLSRFRALAETRSAGKRFAIALVHHNLHARGSRKDAMHGLTNRDALLSTCQSAGVNLMLHGHTHVAHKFEHNGMLVVGSGSSTWDSEDPAHVARYNIYTIDDGALVDTTVRRYDPASKTFSS